MKKVLFAALALAGFASLNAAAAGTATVNVSAAVVGNCQFNTASANMAFGTLDQTVATDATASASLAFWCTTNASYAISDNDGLNKSGTQMRLSNGTNFINYSLGAYTASGTGAGKSSPITLSLSGTIANADYVNAPAGAYADTVTFTITP